MHEFLTRTFYSVEYILGTTATYTSSYNDTRTGVASHLTSNGDTSGREDVDDSEELEVLDDEAEEEADDERNEEQFDTEGWDGCAVSAGEKVAVVAEEERELEMASVEVVSLINNVSFICERNRNITYNQDGTLQIMPGRFCQKLMHWCTSRRNESSMGQRVGYCGNLIISAHKFGS